MDGHTDGGRILQKGETPQWRATAPEWAVADMSPSEGPKGRVVRLGDLGEDVSCERVRTAFNN